MSDAHTEDDDLPGYHGRTDISLDARDQFDRRTSDLTHYDRHSAGHPASCPVSILVGDDELVATVIEALADRLAQTLRRGMAQPNLRRHTATVLAKLGNVVSDGLNRNTRMVITGNENNALQECVRHSTRVSPLNREDIVRQLDPALATDEEAPVEHDKRRERQKG